MIDRTLNYGRQVVTGFLEDAGDFRTVLDIGAGLGFDLAAARRIRESAELHAIEVNSGCVDHLSRQGVQVHQIDLEKERIPLPDGSVDVVLANQVLEHTKEIFWIFHEVSRVLRTGGHFIIGVPNLAAFHNRLLLLAGRQPTPLQNATAHVRGFTKGDILRFAESIFPGGYRLRRFGGSNFYPFPPLLARPLARLLPSMAWGIFLMLQIRRPYHREFLDYPVEKQLETNFFVG